MSEQTEISWTDATFNPWWGCVNVSPACDHCYAEAFAKRVGFSDTGSKFPIWGKDSSRRFFDDKHWLEPIKWDNKARRERRRIRVFCGSMCDVMEDRDDLLVPRWRLCLLVEQTPNLDWLLLTKRAQNFRKFLPYSWMDNPQSNAWLMTTVESPKYFWRIAELSSTPATVRGLSMEPLIQKPIGLEKHLDGISWIITGGESGPHFRTSDPEWFRYVRDICIERNIAFHHKQNGGLRPKSTGCLLDGQEWKQFPNEQKGSG